MELSILYVEKCNQTPKSTHANTKEQQQNKTKQNRKNKTKKSNQPTKQKTH